MNKGMQSSTAVSVLAKLALDFIPGAGPVKSLYEAFNSASESIMKYQEEKYEERAREFHRNLLNGQNSLIGNALTAEDYQALLNACLEDIESSKSIYYGVLARSIGNGEVEEKFKRFLIVTLSQLSTDQIEKLRKGWVASSYTLVTQDRLGCIQSSHFLAGDESEILDEMDLEVLSTKKLVKNRELTVLGRALVESCYETKCLLPESIGETPWVSGALEVITAEAQHHATMDISSRLLSLLNVGLVQAHFLNPENSFKKSKHLMCLPFCVVLIRDGEIFSQFKDEILALVKGRKVLLAFLEGKGKGIVELFPHSEVLEVSKLDRAGQSDILNAIQQAVRRTVDLAVE